MLRRLSLASKIKTVWFKTPDEKSDIEAALRSAPVIQKLRQIAVDRLIELETREIGVEAYEHMSWSHIQAHFNGRKQELNYLLNLLDLGDTE